MLSATACPVFSGKSRYAGKKLIIYLTITSLLNLVGCYYQQQMNVSDYDFKENDKIKIIKKDSTIYTANPYEYQLREDTLFVLQEKTFDNNVKQSIMVGVPLNEIQNIEAEKMDVVDTILFTSAVTVGALILVGIIYVAISDHTYSGPLF